MGSWRRLGAPTGIVLAAALLIAGVVVAARTAPVSQPTLPALRDPDFSHDSNPRVAPLRTDFVARSLGAAALADIAPQHDTKPSGDARATISQGSSRSGRVSAQSASSTSPPVDHGFLTNRLSGGQWDLRLEFAADASHVTVGRDITYTLTARNVGTDRFSGRIDLRSHVPFSTSYFTDPVCAVESVLDNSAAPVDACPLPGLPLPTDQQDMELFGQPIPLTALTWTANATIAPGATFVRMFHVTVTPAAAGTRVLNHAHISVLGSPAQRSGDIAVDVDEVVPR